MTCATETKSENGMITILLVPGARAMVRGQALVDCPLLDSGCDTRFDTGHSQVRALRFLFQTMSRPRCVKHRQR